MNRKIVRVVEFLLATSALLACLCDPASAADCSGAAVASIEFHSEAPIDDGDLRRLIAIRPGLPLCETDVDETRRLLALTEMFQSIAITASAGEAGVIVSVDLVRWPVLGALRIRGNDAFSTEELKRIAHLEGGQVLRDDTLSRARARLVDRYRDAGFESALITIASAEIGDGEQLVTIEIAEGEASAITSLSFAGDLPPGVSDEQLRAAAGLRADERYRRKRVREAERQVLASLRQHGFYEARVESRWLPTTGGGELVFVIDAGPQVSVSFEGNHHLSKRKLLKLIDLDNRAVITDGTWRELAKRARRAYQERGYYFATVELVIRGRSTEGQKQIVFEIQEGEHYRVDQVRFEGNRALADAQLLALLDTRAPSWIPWRAGTLSDAVVEADLDRIEELYAQHGYLHATAEVRSVSRSPRIADGLIVAISIHEGTPTRVRSVDIVGMGNGMVAPVLKTLSGGPYSSRDIETDRRLLLEALQAAGYLDADVDVVVDTEPESTDSVMVSFQVRPGQLQHVGKVVLRNNVDTRAHVILRELTMRQGDVLSPSLLLENQRRLYQLNLFRSVSVVPADAVMGPTRDVVVDVREKPGGSANWGLGYNTRDGFHGFGQVGYANLQGVGRRISLRGEISVEPDNPEPSQYLGDLGFFEPRLSNTAWDLRFDLIGERTQRKVDQYSVERLAVVPALQRTIHRNIRVGTEVVAEDAKVFDVAADVAQEPGFDDERTLTTVSVGPFLVRDARDDAFMPSKGTFESLIVRYAPAAFGSEVPFVKVVAHHSQYVPLPAGLTLAYALRGGWATTMGTKEQVPIRERFFLGGRTTVRGFSENKIGPRATHSDGTSGNPLGGDLVFNSNIELLLPLFYGLKSALFTDAGAVYLQDRGIHSDGVRESAGIGLRYNTPVGPLALDYGFKLDRRSQESIGKLHFSIGAIF